MMMSAPTNTTAVLRLTYTQAVEEIEEITTSLQPEVAGSIDDQPRMTARLDRLEQACDYAVEAYQRHSVAAALWLTYIGRCYNILRDVRDGSGWQGRSLEKQGIDRRMRKLETQSGWDGAVLARFGFIDGLMRLAGLSDSQARSAVIKHYFASSDPVQMVAALQSDEWLGRFKGLWSELRRGLGGQAGAFRLPGQDPQRDVAATELTSQAAAAELSMEKRAALQGSQPAFVALRRARVQRLASWKASGFLATKPLSLHPNGNIASLSTLRAYSDLRALA